MDQAANGVAHENELQERIASALGNGVIFVDRDGRIVWIDKGTRDRLNGGLKDLALPIQKTDGRAIDCVISDVPLTINGEQTIVCVIQETTPPNHDLISAIESVVADTSSFTRSIIDRLKGLRQISKQEATTLPEPSLDIDLLTQREREVLGLICEGHSDSEMSRKLNLSENTVRNHIASLYRKIGVNRRSAAIIWARERAITSNANLSVKPRRRPSANPPER
ncbi:response regulator transcription factor [Bradyrhizobium sp. WSM 1704]|uniref:helix-turn-helix transcriptional regulator n=1 Tax=Bradyrhizobium semiaridum TaxID=2821404 RepID=UPI001CE355B2|nr:response regulator transcription factor [Bradyrhizobium semiaridum]MCA6125776.1 response regulator transcription factor [Bradyrhizobium semiaridum]